MYYTEYCNFIIFNNDFPLVLNVTIYILESGDCTENMTQNHKNI